MPCLRVARRPAVVMLALLALTAAGCGRPRDDFSGLWIDKDRPSVNYLFRPDGTGRLTDDISTPMPEIGSGFEFTWKQVGRELRANFRAVARECRGVMRDRVLILAPLDANQHGEGLFFSMPHTLVRPLGRR